MFVLHDILHPLFFGLCIYISTSISSFISSHLKKPSAENKDHQIPHPTRIRELQWTLLSHWGALTWTIEPRKKKNGSLTFPWNTGWLIGILIPRDPITETENGFMEPKAIEVGIKFRSFWRVTPWSKYMAQSPKGRSIQGLYKPIHGNCAIYFYPGVTWTIVSSQFSSLSHYL